MKKPFIIISAVIIAAGCGNHQQPSAETPIVDSQAKQAIIDSVNTANQNQITADSIQKADSMNAVVTDKKTLNSGRHRSAQSVTQPTASGTAPTTSATSTSSNEPVATAPAETPTAPVAKKKGMNATEKGAIIGSAAGAITGAIAGKHHKIGTAVIGGILGAGAGAGTGAIIDHSKKKKDSTYQQ